MYILFEDAGKFKTGTIRAESDAAFHIESNSGKQLKIKRANSIFTFDDYHADHLIDDATQAAENVDIQFLWEICPQETFTVDALAAEYYGNTPSTLEKTTLLLSLHNHPIYFHRKGKGLYFAAPKDIVDLALAAQEKKKQAAQQQHAWAEELSLGRAPEELRDSLPTFLTHPDKNSLAWKAFEDALEKTHASVESLLLALNVFPNELAIHRTRFLSQHFPKGSQHQSCAIPHYEELPTATVEAFSVDDLSTTEIDDAFAIKKISDDVYIFSIHIACPGLVVERDSELDNIARERMSTVYFPSEKIPMQPDNLIQAFSLNEGKTVPVLSLYITANITTGEIQHEESKLEKVFIKENLRSNHLDPLYTLEAIEDPERDLPYAELFRPMWAFTKHLSKAREDFRGKPENTNKVEYLFTLEGLPDDPDAQLVLTPRMRNAPLDTIVAEFMILCNSHWAALLNNLGLPAIFRSQQNGRVRMSTHANPHEAIGVAHYAWTTSPLRRYVDLFNQRQLIAAVKHGVSARLVAPFKPKDSDIFAIISRFESVYTSYRSYQSNIERYWCLRYLQQNSITRTTASVIKENIVRFEHLPLTTAISGLANFEKGHVISLEILSINLLDLTLECRQIEPS